MAMERTGHYEQQGDVQEWVWDELPEGVKQAGGYTVPEPDFDPRVTPEPEAESESVDLESLTKSELVDMARDAGVEGFSSMNKDELIEALEE